MLNIAAGNPITGYNLSRSLRFRSSASAGLGRTFSTGNRKTWTLSFWVKRGSLGSNQNILVSGPANTTDATFANIGFSSANAFTFTAYSVAWRTTTQVFRDPSAWYHIVVTWDTTQATAADRVKIYVNGSQVTAFSSTFDPSLNFDGAVNQAAATYISLAHLSYGYFDGYLAEINFIDGQGLTPASFGSYNSTTGVWQPAPYTGTYGTNGAYLPFTDNSALTTSSNVGLGKDFSGNGNYWVTTNISITAGVTYDSMTDVPTLTSATAANFAVLNPIAPNLAGTPTFAQANLFVNCANASNFSAVPATMQLPTSGKWYAEFTATLVSTVADIGLLGSTDIPPASGVIGTGATSYGYRNSGNKINNGSNVAYGASYTTGDVIAIAFDATAGSLTFYKNNVSQGVAFTGLTAQYFFAVGGYNFTQWTANFGQRPFTYTPPTGYVALNTYNLPTSTILQGNTVMDATIWTGDGSSPRSITNAAGFKPDLVWAKNRSTSGYWNVLFDSVRGAGNQLSSNETDGELASASNVAGKVSAFNSNGFSLATGSSNIRSVNGNTENYVGWQWQAGQGTTSSNTNGTITSTVSVNASAGFSIVTYTGNGVSGATVGHSLGVTPNWIIVKSRSASGQDWRVYTATVGNTGVLDLNTTNAAVTGQSGFWNNTSPTSSVFSVGGAASTNGNGTTYVAYCFTSITGYSIFSGYTGNGSTDGPMVYTNFRPKLVMAKRTDSTSNWNILDGTRDPYNAVGSYLYPNSSNAEGANASTLDFLANGFKIRQTYTDWNASGGTYVYMAFAENPFKNALAR